MNNNLSLKSILIYGTMIITIVIILNSLSINSFIYNLNLVFASNFELPRLADPNLKVEEVVGGLDMPTSMAFVASDDFLILQKDGKIFRVINETMSRDPLLEVPVAKGFYQGLLGIAVKNNVLENSTFVFLYYTEIPSKHNGNDIGEPKLDATYPIGNRVYRYQLEDNKLVNPIMLLDLPAQPGPEDNGGFITVGPDNNLYIVVGGVTNDSTSSIHTLTQNYVNSSIVDGRAGILRITLEGYPVLDESGHGILGDSYPLNLYYAYGMHNGFGVDFDPLTGNLWDTETGHVINDEINMIKPGFNSGYGVLQGMSTFFPAAPAALVDFNGTGIYSDPEIVWEQKVVPTGIKFLTSDKLGAQYRHDIFVGSFLDDGKLYHFELNQQRDHLLLPKELDSKILRTWNDTGIEKIVFGTGFGGISNLAVGPDGYLYVVSVVNGKIYRIVSIN
jgi:glucose/arabinose dehydrogenase